MATQSILPAALRNGAAIRLGGVIETYTQGMQRNPLESIVNAVAAATLGFFLVKLVATVVHVPVLMPALAQGCELCISALAGTVIFRALDAYLQQRAVLPQG